jgi:hypothetical protein
MVRSHLRCLRRLGVVFLLLLLLLLLLLRTSFHPQAI